MHDLVSKGIIGGIAGTVVFLPQICLLFFLISLLEDTGYLARAAFVMDRLLCRFGLPGHAFVPLLTSHACALPGIMSTRLIPDRRDRFATILVAPFMSCSARLPVYVLLTSLLFAGQPLLAGLAFAACYVLGASAALGSALLFRRTLASRRGAADDSRAAVVQVAVAEERPRRGEGPGARVSEDRRHRHHGDLHRHVVAEHVSRASVPHRRPRPCASQAAAAADPVQAEALRADARDSSTSAPRRPAVSPAGSGRRCSRRSRRSDSTGS